MRPPVAAGPMLRHSSPFKTVGFTAVCGNAAVTKKSASEARRRFTGMPSIIKRPPPRRLFEGLLSRGLLRQPLGDPFFEKPEYLLDVGERSGWVVVVTHQAMLVVLAIRGKVIN